MNTEKFLIQTERLVTERSHRKKPDIVFKLKMLSLKYWLQSTQIKEVRGRSPGGPSGRNKNIT